MKYYSLDCSIRTDNDGIRNAVQQLLPAQDDPRVHAGAYEFWDILDKNGVKEFSCNIRFYSESERDGMLNSIKGLTGIINACELGSFVASSIYNHAEGSPCERQIMIRKD